MKIGVLSDTHDFLDPLVLKLFQGVDHILHAGDIGQPALLTRLRSIAPVTAVCGNTDDPTFHYPFTASVELDGLRFLLHHIVNPLSRTGDLDSRIQEERADFVIFGHTHKPCDQVIDNVRFFNPGYAGKARFNLKRTVAVLSLQDRRADANYFGLE